MNNILIEKINKKEAEICVIGLGYIGLPLSLSFANCGFKVLGIDIDKQKIKNLNQQISYISDISNEDLKNTISNQKIEFTSDYHNITSCDAIIICVPTPLNKTKDPDISYIVAVAEEISKYDISNKLISLESTVYPGATEEIILPILSQNSKFNVGKDFNVIFSPERIDPGQKNWDLKNTPKVIGGITKECGELGMNLYNCVSEKIVQVSSTRAAEMTKLLENTFRAANIGLINEMAILCQKLDLDIWEVIEAAKTKPYGYMPFYPGPGLGGHCIPVDPRYLEWKLETLNSESKYIKLSEEINFSMPQYVVDRAKEIISKNKLENKITIIGATYKKDVSDIRESPAIDIMQILHDEKIPFNYNDPYIHEIKLSNKTYYSESINNLNNNQILGIIVTDHSSYNWAELSENFKFIFDTRNALRNFNKQDVNIFKL